MVRKGDVPFESEADQLNEIPIFEQSGRDAHSSNKSPEPALLL